MLRVFYIDVTKQCVLVWVSYVVLAVFQCCSATANMQFCSRASKIVLGNPVAGTGAGRFQVSTAGASAVLGWPYDSIIKHEYNSNGYLSTTSWLSATTYTESSIYGDLINATSNWVNANGVRVRTTSNWVNANGVNVRTTSNWVNANGMPFRTTSNWVNANGVMIRTTSNAVSAGGGTSTLLRTTSNWVNANDIIVRTTSNAVSTGGGTSTLLRTTSNWVNANGMIVRTTSNSVNTFSSNIASLQGRVSNLADAVVPASITTSSYMLAGNYDLGTSNPVTVYTNLSFDGSGNYIQFGRINTGHRGPRSSSGFIEVAAGKTLTFTNIVLRDFTDDVFILHRGASVVFGDKTIIELAERETLAFNWVTSGQVLINGIGNTLDLDGHQLNIDSGSLRLQNLSLVNVTADSITCGADNTKLNLSNAVVNLAGDFDFTVGGITIDDKVVIAGQSTLGYATNQPLAINSNATLMFDTGSGFAYKPTSNNRDLITMADSSSTLQLNGCTLSSTTTGMRLMTGRLIVDSNNDIDNTGAVSLSQAVSFGNGTSSDDLTIDIMPGGSIHMTGGILDYENAS